MLAFEKHEQDLKQNKDKLQKWKKCSHRSCQFSWVALSKLQVNKMKYPPFIQVS